MPAITSCPECNKNLQVPNEFLGKKVRCPGCKLGFIAQDGPGLREVVDEPDWPADRAPPRRSEAYSERRSARADEGGRYTDRRPRRDDHDDDRRDRENDDEYDDERRSRRRDNYDDDRGKDDRRTRRRGPADDEGDYQRRRSEDAPTRWARVQLGMTLVIIADWIVVGCIVLSIFSWCMIRLALVLSWIFSLAGIAVLVLHVLGSGLCMLVPGKRNGVARGLAITSFICTALVVAAFATVQTMALAAGGVGVAAPAGFALVGIAGVLMLFTPALWLAADICWMLFLRLIAIACHYEELASQIVGFMVAALIYFVLIVAYYFTVVGLVLRSAPRWGAQGGGAGLDGGAGMWCIGLVGILFWLLGIGGYVYYIVRLLTPARDLVYQKLRRG
jgi:hypothetical protein